MSPRRYAPNGTQAASAATGSPILVGQYLRISKDLELIGAGIERQTQDTGRLTAERGWRGELYVDNNVSAYQRKRRPEFERLLADLESGRLGGVVVYDIDRLARQPRDVERLLDIFEANRSLVFGTCQGELDPATTDGQFMIRLLVNVAAKSSADTARRVARSHLQRAQEGSVTSGCRAFGWAADKVQLDPIEAPILRQAAEDVIAGLSLNGIVNRWNAEGITTANGKPWLKTSLRMLLLSPRLAGYRVHQGGIATDLTGAPVMGPHAPIVTVEQWETLRAIIRDPSRVNNAHPGGRKYLLAGIIRCGRCSSLMSGNARPAPYSHFYSCKSGCRHNNIDGARTDALVAELFKRHIAVAGEQAPADERWSGEEELAQVMGRIDDLMARFTDLTLSADLVFPAVAKLQARKAELDKSKAEWRRDRGPVTVDIETDWDALSVEQQRAALARSLQTIAVGPTTGRRFDPERIEPVWQRATPATQATA